MYLSRLRLNPADASARRDLADPYQMHRTLARVYAPDTEQAPSRFLWRMERNAQGWADGTVLVQAAEPGHWDALQAQPDYLQTLEADKPIEVNALIHPERRYRFRLYANPTVTRDGKRYGLIHEEDQLAWLDRQGERCGFQVIGAVCGGSHRLSTRQGREGGRITVLCVLFDGLLQAGTDPEPLRQVLTQGLGHAKALGLGLLSVAPARP
ncbi:type I-E CRISPR-associated protein Cas6/Cse3/CasE [Leptothrix ochracea]|uniref:type I-E CRISPR-associated protein Cas6/Cse3/CasE n=1 Tax=Leptothrix ochracea TaxID=735331 RepID=UPI0034E1C984